MRGMLSEPQVPTDGPGSGSEPAALQRHPPQQQPDSSSAKLTRGSSCVLCQQRKVRCDKRKPCVNCVKAMVECKVVPPAPPRRRRKRLHKKDLIDRLNKYETLLREHGVKFDAIGYANDPQPDDVDELENDLEGPKTSPEASASPSGSPSHTRTAGSWLSLHREFRAGEHLLQDSSEDEGGVSTIHRAYDTMFGNQDGFPFVVTARKESVTADHPPTIHIFRLWQIYIDNINPLLKITHAPTVQGKIVEATSQLDRAPKNIEALMFAIYLMAVTSLEDFDVQRRFGEPKQELLGRYFSALQQALLNAGFMRNHDFYSLQAYVLYLLAVRWFVDPRQMFCLTGIAVRIAQRMGLHQDPGGSGLPPFEMEQRRRLWWTIVGYDRRIGEMTGSTVTALSSGGDCKMPLNVNDSDLHVEGEEMPAPHTGPTEMLFALTRIEIAMAVASNSNRDSHKMNSSEKASPGSSQGPGPRRPPVTIRVAGQDSPTYTLDGFCAHIEGTYLSQCDPKIPLHFFTLTMTRQSLCMMRIVGFLVGMHNAEAMPVKEAERESLFLQATQMVEFDNVVQSSESLRSFRWFSMHHFPFLAYMFLVQELRHRVTGPMAERAWEAIGINHDLRGLLNNTHSPMHAAFGKLFCKAWDAYETAQKGSGRQVQPPRFISLLKERAEGRRRARAENRRDNSLDQAPVDLPRFRGTEQTSLGRSAESHFMMASTSADHTMSGTGPLPTMVPQAMSPVQGTNDTDWSYLVSVYQDMEPFQGFNFGGFSNPMGGTLGGGMGPSGSGNIINHQ